MNDKKVKDLTFLTFRKGNLCFGSMFWGFIIHYYYVPSQNDSVHPPYHLVGVGDNSKFIFLGAEIYYPVVLYDLNYGIELN